jgi:hypothetical protein
MNRPSASIKRASALMGTPSNPDAYMTLKITPDGGGCCCTDCWPEAWRAVNRHIAPAGPIGHEGDVLLGNGDSRFVLEGHESGPEIVLYLGVATASILTVKAIVELMTTILKNLVQDRKHPSRIRLIKRVSTKGEFEEKVTMELDLPLSSEAAKELESQVRKALIGHRTRKSSVRRGARR